MPAYVGLVYAMMTEGCVFVRLTAEEGRRISNEIKDYSYLHSHAAAMLPCSVPGTHGISSCTLHV